MTITSEQIAATITEAVTAWDQGRDRSQQTRDRILGVSDIGNCREYARLITTDTPFSDERANMMPAIVGTWIHQGVTEALHGHSAQWMSDLDLKITLPSGHTLNGHPDWVIPGVGVVDLKTSVGLEQAIKYGPDQQQTFQVMLYALGAIQAGILTEDCTVSVAWLDRTGKRPDVHVWTASYDPLVVAAADEWITDVVYAVQQGEQASKDKPYQWCEKVCPYFTACRGGEANPEGGLIEDPELIRAVDLYVEGNTVEKQGKRMKEEAKALLDGVSGLADGYAVKWTYVNETEVPGFTRAGYSKITVTKVKKP